MADVSVTSLIITRPLSCQFENNIIGQTIILPNFKLAPDPAFFFNGVKGWFWDSDEEKYLHLPCF